MVEFARHVRPATRYHHACNGFKRLSAVVMAGHAPDIVTPEFRRRFSGCLGAEGPVFTKEGHFYMVAPEVEVQGRFAGQILTAALGTPEETPKVLCSPSVGGEGGVPAGCQADRQSNIWVADMRLGLLKVKATGEYEQVSTVDSEDNTMQGCNDCVFDVEGNLWVTAPAGPIAPQPYTRSMEEPFGSVYCLPEGSSRPVKIATDFRFPNGIAFKPGEPSLLIVAETPTKTLWAYDVTGPAQITNKRVWGKLPGDHEGGPDGMDFDADGFLLVANWGGGHIEVFPPTGGVPSLRIRCPFARVSNVHFRPNSHEVFVTEHTNHALWSFEWRASGRKEYCES